LQITPKNLGIGMAVQFSERKGKAGYSPVCENEWINSICNKPAIKCSECKNQKYLF